LIGALARHRLPDGRVLDAETAVAACFFVFVAGQSTTGQLIATVLRRASAESGIWLRLANEKGLAEAWVEEVLRREPPVTTWRRVTAQATELGGVSLPAGAQLLLMLLGSGSDPEVFPDPEQMCPYRSNARHHLAFGAGHHRCPGTSLARTEAAVALRAAARNLPDVQLADEAGEPPMLRLSSFRASLKVAVAQSKRRRGRPRRTASRGDERVRRQTERGVSLRGHLRPTGAEDARRKADRWRSRASSPWVFGSGRGGVRGHIRSAAPPAQQGVPAVKIAVAVPGSLAGQHAAAVRLDAIDEHGIST
jgi:hypothetical protein